MDKCIRNSAGAWLVDASQLRDRTLVFLTGIDSLRRIRRLGCGIGFDHLELEPHPVLDNVTLAAPVDPLQITRWATKPRIWWQSCYEVPEQAKLDNLDILLPDGTLLRPQWASNGATLTKLAQFEQFVVARRLPN